MNPAYASNSLSDECSKSKRTTFMPHSAHGTLQRSERVQLHDRTNNFMPSHPKLLTNMYWTRRKKLQSGYLIRGRCIRWKYFLSNLCDRHGSKTKAFVELQLWMRCVDPSQRRDGYCKWLRSTWYAATHCIKNYQIPRACRVHQIQAHCRGHRGIFRISCSGDTRVWRWEPIGKNTMHIKMINVLVPHQFDL